MTDQKIDEQPVTQKKISKQKSERTYQFQVPKTKFELVRAILVRWWYGMKPYPDPNYDYTQKLADQKLRLVDEQNWKTEPEVKDGFLKVKACQKFPGWFVDASNQMYDLRSKKKMPSFHRLKKMEIKELSLLLKKCIENQIKTLIENPEYYENNLEYALRKFLKRFLRNFENYLK